MSQNLCHPRKLNQISMELIFFSTVATISIFQTQAWNEMKTYFPPAKDGVKQDLDPKLGTAFGQSQLNESIVELTIFPLTDRYATLTVTIETQLQSTIYFNFFFSKLMVKQLKLNFDVSF